MKIFFSDYETAEHVSGNAPRAASLQEALAKFDSISNKKGCFFGIVDTNNQTLQFMRNDDGTLFIDIPVTERRGSLTRDSASMEECRQLLIDCEREILVNRIPGLSFEPW